MPPRPEGAAGYRAHHRPGAQIKPLPGLDLASILWKQRGRSALRQRLTRLGGSQEKDESPLADVRTLVIFSKLSTVVSWSWLTV